MQVENEVVVTLPRSARSDIQTALSPIEVTAPVAKGSPVGSVTISALGHVERRVPLLAAAEIARLGLIGRLRRQLSALIGR